jgi:hypothetical protein
MGADADPHRSGRDQFVHSPRHAALSRAHRLRSRRAALARRVLAFRTARRRSSAGEDCFLPIRHATPPVAFANAPALPFGFDRSSRRPGCRLPLLRYGQQGRFAPIWRRSVRLLLLPAPRRPEPRPAAAGSQLVQVLPQSFGLATVSGSLGTRLFRRLGRLGDALAQFVRPLPFSG